MERKIMSESELLSRREELIEKYNSQSAKYFPEPEKTVQGNDKEYALFLPFLHEAPVTAK